MKVLRQARKLSKGVPSQMKGSQARKLLRIPHTCKQGSPNFFPNKESKTSQGRGLAR